MSEDRDGEGEVEGPASYGKVKVSGRAVLSGR